MLSMIMTFLPGSGTSNSGTSGPMYSANKGGGNDRGDKNKSVFSTAIFTSISALLENLKLQRQNNSVLLDSSSKKASSSTDIAINDSASASVNFYDCVIGGTVTVGVSLALLQLSLFVWRRVLIFYSRQRRNHLLEDKSNKSDKRSQQKRRKQNYAHQPSSDDESDVEDGKRKEEKDTTLYSSPDSYYFAVHSPKGVQIGASRISQMQQPSPSPTFQYRQYKGSCRCKSVQFILRLPTILYRPQQNEEEENRSSPSKVVLQAYDSPGKIRFPRLPIDSASKHFELNPSSIPALRIYRVPVVSPSSLASSTLGHTSVASPSTVNVAQESMTAGASAAHAFCIICGVHILYAPDGTRDLLEVNVHCLDDLNIANDTDLTTTLEVVWRPMESETLDMLEGSVVQEQLEINSRYDDLWTDHPLKLNKTMSTPMTEATTVTATTSSTEHRTTLNDGSTSSLESECSISTALFPDGISGKGPSFDDGVSLWTGVGGVTAIGESVGAVWEKASTPFVFSSGIRMTIPSTGDVTTRPGSTSAASLWRKKKKSAIDTPLKQNLMYYMRRHFKSPSDAEEE